MYRVVKGLVPALPTDTFVTFSKCKRQIKPKTFGDCVTINPVEKHKANNKKCLTIPYSRTTQYQNNFFVDTVIRWNHLPDTDACAKSLEEFKTGQAPIKSRRLSLPLYENHFPGTTTYSIQLQIQNYENRSLSVLWKNLMFNSSKFINMIYYN